MHKDIADAGSMYEDSGNETSSNGDNDDESYFTKGIPTIISYSLLFPRMHDLNRTFFLRQDDFVDVDASTIEPEISVEIEASRWSRLPGAVAARWDVIDGGGGTPGRHSRIVVNVVNSAKIYILHQEPVDLEVLHRRRRDQPADLHEDPQLR